VQRIPEFEEANAAANYQSPPKDGSRPGIFRVPLRGPNFSRAGMRTLAAHEAIPGHHFQLALQVEMTTLPAFRRESAFGVLSAFAEGWGLYAQRLASELGWYKDDVMSDIGWLSGELFRAKRLVVDTGLHIKRWTRQLCGLAGPGLLLQNRADEDTRVARGGEEKHGHEVLAQGVPQFGAGQRQHAFDGARELRARMAEGHLKMDLGPYLNLP
jgi:uncharacterized protein (DUF885 family)